MWGSKSRQQARLLEIAERRLDRIETRLDAFASEALTQYGRIDVLAVEPPGLPHVVLEPGEVIVLTIPRGFEPSDLGRFREAFERVGLGDRVIMISDEARTRLGRPLWGFPDEPS